MKLMPAFTQLLFLIKRALFIVILCSITSACVSTSDKPNDSGKAKLSKSEQAMIHTKLAKGYMQQKQYATAQAELEEALDIYPGHSDSNYVMALLMTKLEQYDDAEKYYKRAVNNDAKNSAAAHDFGVFLCQLGKEKEAIEYFDVAVANPLFEKAELSYMRAGECLSKVDDAKAEQYLKKALSINPRLRPALYRLAIVKFGEDNFLSARAYIERYFAITNPQPASLLLAYKIESNLNATDVAEGYRSKLLKEFPGSKEAATLRPNRN